MRPHELRTVGSWIAGTEVFGDWAEQGYVHQCRLLQPPSPAWRTTDVLRLAGALHAGAPADGLPVLADALQDAGCDDASSSITSAPATTTPPTAGSPSTF